MINVFTNAKISCPVWIRCTEFGIDFGNKQISQVVNGPK